MKYFEYPSKDDQRSYSLPSSRDTPDSCDPVLPICSNFSRLCFGILAQISACMHFVRLYNDDSCCLRCSNSVACLVYVEYKRRIAFVEIEKRPKFRK